MGKKARRIILPWLAGHIAHQRPLAFALPPTSSSRRRSLAVTLSFSARHPLAVVILSSSPSRRRPLAIVVLLSAPYCPLLAVVFSSPTHSPRRRPLLADVLSSPSSSSSRRPLLAIVVLRPTSSPSRHHPPADVLSLPTSSRQRHLSPTSSPCRCPILADILRPRSSGLRLPADVLHPGPLADVETTMEGLEEEGGR